MHSGAYPCMTALAWVRCAWAQHLFPAAPPRTAALQSQTGNPWCWSAAGWPPDQGALTAPDQCPEMSVSCWGGLVGGCPPCPGASLHASPESGSRERGEGVAKSWLCSPAQSAACWQGGDFCSVKWVEERWCRSHGSPCGGPGYVVPWLVCSSPR